MITPLAMMKTNTCSLMVPSVTSKPGPQMGLSACYNPCGTDAPSTFAALLAQGAKETCSALQHSERLNFAAANGTADPQDVALNVVKAKAALNQFSSLVSAGISAFQEVMRIAL
jgi:flagellar hook-basal body complex protein FliE